jgi:glycosyltransferase involved in cell wall biosynthesis
MHSSVDVVMPTYNGASRGRCSARPGGFLSEAIESVLSQSFPDFQLFITDDGSTDETATVLARYEDDSRVHVIRQGNRGVSAARNSSIRAGSGGLIAFLDDDDSWHPDKLERQVAFMNAPESSGIAMTFTGIDLVDSGGRLVGTQQHSVHGDVYRALFYENVIDAPSSVMIRRNVLEEVGLFREDLRGAEDKDLWFRVAKGHKILPMGERLVNYRVHAAKLSSDNDLMDRCELEALSRALADAPEAIVAEESAIRAATYRRFADKHFSANSFDSFRKYAHEAIRYGDRSLALNLRMLVSHAGPVVSLGRMVMRAVSPRS